MNSSNEFEGINENAELRVRVTEQQWGGFNPTYIRHFESIKSLQAFMLETGYQVEILEIVEQEQEPQQFSVRELGGSNEVEYVDSLAAAIKTKLSWKVLGAPKVAILNPDGYIVSEKEQQEEILRVFAEHLSK